MDSILEERRLLHEERDRIEIAIVNEMLNQKNSHKDKLDSEHRQKILLDRYMKCSKNLLSMYQPDSPQTLREKNLSLDTAFNDFYVNLRKIKDFYSSHSNEQVVTLANEFEEIEAARQIAQGTAQNPSKGQQDVQDAQQDDEDDNANLNVERQRLTQGLPSTDLIVVTEQPKAARAEFEPRVEKLVEFTSEEGYGKFLDLTKCHELYLQVVKKFDKKPNYFEFIASLHKSSEINRDLRLTSAYKTYIEANLEYFRDYCRRAKPLVDYDDMEEDAHKEFVEKWNNRSWPGWFKESEQKSAEDSTPMVDLDAYKDHEELMQLGLDNLKQELQARNLKCGGTLEDRAKRLWSVRGKADHEIDESVRAGSIVGKKRKLTIEPFRIASMEAKLEMYAKYFSEYLDATYQNVLRKHSLRDKERIDSSDEDDDVNDADDDPNDVVYNPKNLPLGWDGKPIPYWLYKLHGLNQSFTCEICGNTIYKGPKTFQRHFSEWRHAHGMKCLGVPNTAHFANITKIQDVLSLWEKLKNEKQRGRVEPDRAEEYEDSQGNVINKKIYEDLKRQGLL